jgi:anti-sigma factor RsiW
MSNDDHDHKHCLEMFDKLSEYIDGELDHATCEKIQKHAESCVACFSCL